MTALAETPLTAIAEHTRARSSSHGAWLRERGVGATVLVAAISAAFGVLLIAATGFIAAWLRALPYMSDSGTVVVIIGILSVLLVGVAIYVAAIVTANTFATIIAGRTRQIALMRLIGASARSQRSAVAREGLVVGVIGAAIGLVAGVALAFGLRWFAEAAFGVSTDYVPLQVAFFIPAIAVALTTWCAAWAGSRRVLDVTPLQALSASGARTHDEVSTRGRAVGSLVLLVVGGVLLALGVLAGLVSPLGVVIAFLGGILSFTGFATGAHVVIPPLLRATGRLLGRSAPARLAAENAMRYPERSSRMAIGVVMGVTLVMMFAVATESVKEVLRSSAGGELPPDLAVILDTFSGIMMGVVAVAAVIAAVGLVNLLTISVVQRRRELGLLRALGLSSSQVRRMVLLEAVHITLTALVAGLLLGALYGWVAAQSLLGSTSLPPVFEAPTLIAPAVPLVPLLIVVAATAVLTLVAAVVPTRLATRVTPVEALAEA